MTTKTNNKKKVKPEVYLLHFFSPYWTTSGPCRHYVGYAHYGAADRIAKHRAGNGSLLVDYALRHGGQFCIARVWSFEKPSEAKWFERQRKKNGHFAKMCPNCKGGGYVLMGLEQLNFEGRNKTEVALDILRQYEPPEGYYLAFSGGKDSVAIYDLAERSGVKFDAHYCVSPIDPPQIYKFIKEYYPTVKWDIHARGFWRMVEKKGLPMRQARWCCSVIKEAGGADRTVITGVRRGEGSGRKNYPVYEPVYKRRISRKDNLKTKLAMWLGIDVKNKITAVKKAFVRPILDFDNFDIWAYIADRNLPYCDLYNQGFKRLGCVLCPFSRDIKREIDYFPKIAGNWLRVCNRIVATAIESGRERKHDFQTGQELFDWWVSRK